MNPLGILSLRHKWRDAQRIHDMEHETGQVLTLTCKAVGHLDAIDAYSDCFDADARRHFLREYRDVKYA